MAPVEENELVVKQVEQLVVLIDYSNGFHMMHKMTAHFVLACHSCYKTWHNITPANFFEIHLPLILQTKNWCTVPPLPHSTNLQPLPPTFLQHRTQGRVATGNAAVTNNRAVCAQYLRYLAVTRYYIASIEHFKFVKRIRI